MMGQKLRWTLLPVWADYMKLILLLCIDKLEYMNLLIQFNAFDSNYLIQWMSISFPPRLWKDITSPQALYKQLNCAAANWTAFLEVQPHQGPAHFL